MFALFLFFSQSVIFGYTCEYEHQWLSGCVSPVTDWQPVPGETSYFPATAGIGPRQSWITYRKWKKMDGFGIPDKLSD